jgi:hypothetical protein
MPGEGAWAQSPPRARPPQRARQGELVRDMLPPARATRLPAREVLVDRPHRGPARQREPPLGMQEMEWAESHVSWLGDSSTARSRRLSGGGMRLSKSEVRRTRGSAITHRTGCVPDRRPQRRDDIPLVDERVRAALVRLAPRGVLASGSRSHPDRVGWRSHFNSESPWRHVMGSYPSSRSGRISIASLIALLLVVLVVGGALFYRRSSGTSLWETLRSVKDTSQDAATTSKVKTALLLSKHVSAFDIKATTSRGEVTLTGEVPTARKLGGSPARLRRTPRALRRSATTSRSTRAPSVTQTWRTSASAWPTWKSKRLSLINSPSILS